MYQPDPVPGHRITRSPASPAASRYPARSRRAGDPGLRPGDGRTPAPRWRVIAACAACALAGLAAGTLLARAPARPPATASTAPASTGSPAAPARPRAAPAPGSTVPVYRLLPLTARQLSAAATVAARFTAAYCTYSSAQPPAAWLARLRTYTAAALQAELTQASTDPVLLKLRARQHVTATCMTAATAIRDIASTAVTVAITTRQAIRIRNRTNITTAAYAITIAPGGGSSGWKVYDIQPASAGQAGGTLP